MAKKVTTSQKSPIYSSSKNMLILRDFKIYPGMYHHTITISSSNDVTHKSYKLSDDEMTAIDGVSYNSISALPTYTENNVSGETLNCIIVSHNSNATKIPSTVLTVNRCQINTGIRID